jgi:GT2 family glycosyltransferase
MTFTELNSTVEGILFILVIYKRRLNESDSFISLVNSLKNTHLNIDIFIYDNSPSSMILNEELSGENWKIHYVHDETNPGVSKAYNEGFKLGKKLNKKWLLLLDQDTKLPDDAIIKYCRAVLDNNEHSLFAPILVSTNGTIYSPCNYFFKRGFPMKSIEIGILKARRKSLLNSGLLISVDIFEKVGGYNERLKLDFSDFEFLDRYRKISDNFFIINTECIHELSSNEQDFHSSITNFTRYCKGLKIYIVADFDSFCLFYLTLIRACKLSFRFRNINFIVVFFVTLLSISTFKINT